MAFKLDEQAVLKDFNRLVALGAIRYGSSEAIRLVDKDFSVMRQRVTFGISLTSISVRIPHMPELVSEAYDSGRGSCSLTG
jgi:hypothetical protein